MFEEMHSDLYDVDFWQGLQEKIRDGFVLDVFPIVVPSVSIAAKSLVLKCFRTSPLISLGTKD